MRNLRTVRKSKKLSLRDVAKALDVDHSLISYWETGKRNPNEENIVKLENYFSQPIEKLLGTDEKKKENVNV